MWNSMVYGFPVEFPQRSYWPQENKWTIISLLKKKKEKKDSWPSMEKLKQIFGQSNNTIILLKS